MRWVVSLLFAAIAIAFTKPAFAVDYRWTQSYDQGTSEAIIENASDASVNIYCPSGQTDTTPGMFVDSRKVRPKAGESVRVQIIVDGDNYPFDLDEDKFKANSNANMLQFQGLLTALTASRARRFTVEFPKYKISEQFSLLDAAKILGKGKSTILDGCEN